MSSLMASLVASARSKPPDRREDVSARSDGSVDQILSANERLDRPLRGPGLANAPFGTEMVVTDSVVPDGDALLMQT